MTTDNEIKDLKLQYDVVNREAAKILALSSDEIDKYECFTGEKILPSDQSRIIEKVETLKTLELEERKEDIKPIKGVFPEKKREQMKLKMKHSKLNGKIKLNKIIYNMKQKITNMIFSNMKQ